MARLLLTGISGTGKSSVVAALGAHGIEAVDTDEDGWRRPPDRPAEPGEPVQPDWGWDLERMAALLDAPRTEPLVVAGCHEDQGRFLDRFEHVVVVTAPWPVLEARLATRTTNAYGRRPEEREQIRGELQEVEPLLRRWATRVIDTGATPLDEVVALVVADLRS